MKRNYAKVNDKMRYDLIKLIANQKLTIRDAAKQLDLNYENAKAIYRTYRLNKRINKIKFRRHLLPETEYGGNLLNEMRA